jgi:hypothetical protein
MTNLALAPLALFLLYLFYGDMFIPLHLVKKGLHGPLTASR